MIQSSAALQPRPTTDATRSTRCARRDREPCERAGVAGHGSVGDLAGVLQAPGSERQRGKIECSALVRLTPMERTSSSALAEWFFTTALMAIYATNSRIIPHHGVLFLLLTLPFMFMLALSALAWGFAVLGLSLRVLRKISS